MEGPPKNSHFSFYPNKKGKRSHWSELFSTWRMRNISCSRNFHFLLAKCCSAPPSPSKHTAWLCHFHYIEFLYRHSCQSSYRCHRRSSHLTFKVCRRRRGHFLLALVHKEKSQVFLLEIKLSNFYFQTKLKETLNESL